MDSVLITGAGRGIGLEFARQYAADGWQVFACCRNPAGAEELNTLSKTPGVKLSIHKMDTTDEASIKAVADELVGEEIDILINNAGISGRRDVEVGSMDYDSWAEVMQTNVFAPMKVTEAFMDHVCESYMQLVVMISSRMGSVGDTTSGGSMIYRSSKSALNMAMRCLALETKSRGLTTVSVHPGWVRTDMGGSEATLTPHESVSALRNLFFQLRDSDSGKFYNYDGTELPW
jgi:NAD(P)-dependent dehydrogenase (short-subunit alcohol dehydrogenase family)